MCFFFLEYIQGKEMRIEIGFSGSRLGWYERGFHLVTERRDRKKRNWSE